VYSRIVIIHAFLSFFQSAATVPEFLEKILVISAETNRHERESKGRKIAGKSLKKHLLAG
jgi:hypothetical protein